MVIVGVDSVDSVDGVDGVDGVDSVDGKRPWNAKVNIVLVNNASRNGRVLKFILVIQAIEEYLSILGCHLPEP